LEETTTQKENRKKENEERKMIKPYYEEPGITIYHGDCRDILPHLERECFEKWMGLNDSLDNPE
jgi:hypothetical protein